MNPGGQMPQLLSGTAIACAVAEIRVSAGQRWSIQSDIFRTPEDGQQLVKISLLLLQHIL